VKAILWGLVEWGDAVRPTDEDQQTLDDAASLGSPGQDPDDDGIPF
jgi:hypothetical protein